MKRRLAEFLKDLAWLNPRFRAVLAAFAVLLVFLSAFSWSAPGLRDLELSLYDLRAALNTREISQDERIVLVAYTDETLLQTGERSPLDRTILANALRNLDAAGATAIGIDILIDQPADDDALLVAALHDMRTPVFLGGVDGSRKPASISNEQEKFLREFPARAENPAVKSGNISLAADDDGAIRNWPDYQHGSMPSMAVALAEAAGSRNDFSQYDGPIDFGVAQDGAPFATLSIELVADEELMEELAPILAGKLVLIGGDIFDVDRFYAPATLSSGDGWIPGLQIHAQMLAQALDGTDLTPFPAWANFVLALASLTVGIAISLTVTRKRWLLLLLGALATTYVALSFGIHAWMGESRNVGVVGWIFALLSTAWLATTVHRGAKWEQGRTATLALHRYLPPDVAQSIVSSPDRLGLEGETRDVFVMFTDLEGFTSMCQSVPANAVAEFLNQYLEEVSQIILAHGGTIDKFVGDAVIGFWGAPVAHDDDGERAVRAALEILEKSEEFRGRDMGGDALVGRTRIGVHYGSAIVGNFGGEGRLQYTALGDTMNVGARLEGANKQLKTSILISGEAYSHVRGSIACRAMGRVRVRGRSAPIEIFEPVQGATLKEIESLNAAYYAARNGDAGALNKLQAWAIGHPADQAFADLIARLSGSGESTATDLD